MEIRTTPSRAHNEGSANRGGGRALVTMSKGSQMVPSTSIMTAVIKAIVYNLTQQETKEEFDVVTCITLISNQPCRIFFKSGTSHPFIAEKLFALLDLSHVILQTV